MRNIVGTTRALLSIGYAGATAYTFTMLLSLITGPAYIFLQYIIWKALFSASGTDVIGGMTFDQILAYAVVTRLTFYIMFDMVHEEVNEAIHQGRLTIFLLRPLSFIYQQLIEKVADRSRAIVLEVIPVFIIAVLLFGKTIYTEGHFFWFVASWPIVIVLSFFLRLILGCVSFWITRPRSIFWAYWVFLTITSGWMLPLSFFPAALQKVLFFLPFQFIGYVPGALYAGEYSLGGIVLAPWQLLLYGVGQTVFWGVIAVIVWRFALKRYTAVGA